MVMSIMINYCAPYCQNMMDVPLVVQGCVLVAGIQKDDEMNMVGTVESKPVKINEEKYILNGGGKGGKKERSSQERGQDKP